MDLSSANDMYRKSSGLTVSVWDHHVPLSSFPQFPELSKNLNVETLVVGSGITGLTTAYELVKLGKKVSLIEARGVISGESARTTGHLSSGDQGDRYYNLIDTFGEEGAKKIWQSHGYAVHRVGEIAKEVGIECDYKNLPAVLIKAPGEENDLEKEYKVLQKLGIPSSYQEDGKVGEGYHGPVLRIEQQGRFHPTEYFVGLLKYLKSQPSFEAYSNTRYVSHEKTDSGLECSIKTESQKDLKIVAKNVVLATNMPPRKLSMVIKQHYMRSYVIAAPISKNAYPDELVYDNADPYIYVRKSKHTDSNKEWLIIGGQDHKVGIPAPEAEEYSKAFSELEKWGREHYKQMGQVEYRWSGQVVENSEGLGYAGQSGDEGEYLVTGDNGNGLTHGTLSAKIIVDQITGTQNAWSDLYSPSRKPSTSGLSGLYETAKENVIQQAEYVRLIVPDISSIEDLPKCSGRVLTHHLSPQAVYKDENGNLTKFSALCPHMKGVVKWNPVEKSWDCPNHGSRFAGGSGECVMGPSKMGLSKV